ncbi:MAG TPA: hypothetical protein PKV40_07350 [Candidatus Kapabacteria bacterium]|nr:hypothetical protein [Candidatus Kapabacteria bacterium]
MRNIHLIIFALLFYSSAHSQIPYTLNLQGIGFPTGMSAISINENQYLYDSTSKFENAFSISYQRSRFGLTEISPVSIMYSNNMIKNSGFFANLDYFGFELYNEFAASVGGYTKLKFIEIGGKATYHRANIKDYGNSSAISVDMYAKLCLLDNLAFGLLLENLNRAYYTNANRTVPQSAILSIGYTPLEQLGIDFGANIDLNTNASMIAAIRYKFNHYLQANIKCNTSPFLIIGGINLSAFDYFNILFFLRYEEEFGYDQIIGLEFKF